MASVVVNGDTSGAVTLSAPAVAGTVTVTLPSTSGTMASLASVTANGVTYVNSSSQPTSGSALVFDGTNFSTTGTIKGSTTISVGAATPSTSGAGITFPATQSASSDANTLDDYEEGTWTPSIAFGGGTTGITYSTQVALYTKIGRMVHVSGYIALSSKGSSTGTATLINFPFSSINIANQYLSAMQGWYIQLATGQGIIFDMSPNNNLVTLKYPSATSVSTHTDTTFNNNTAFEFSFVYSA